MKRLSKAGLGSKKECDVYVYWMEKSSLQQLAQDLPFLPEEERALLINLGRKEFADYEPF